MDTSKKPSVASERTSTGVHGLDVVLGGGLFRNAIYMIAGRPGAGKTILSNQIAFQHVKEGGRVVYATLLAETHGRLISQLRGLSFFDEEVIGKDLKYLNALDAITEGGLPGLLDVVRRIVRDNHATLLVLDGMVTAETLAKSDHEYKRFISELQTWVTVVGCTVVFVTSSGLGAEISPEHTMVDGIIDLSSERIDMRSMRYLTVVKLRGAAFLEGRHSYLITGDGVAVYPRTEARFVDVAADAGDTPSDRRLATGIPRFDAALGGGIVAQSTTLLLGSSGAGKSIMGLQFLAEGARRGEKCLHFGCFEPPGTIVAKADRLGLDFSGLTKKGDLFLYWFRPAEILIDALIIDLLEIVRAKKIERLLIDGFVGFRSTHPPDRVSAVFSALSIRLVANGVTTLITDETRELFVREVEVPTANVSAIFHNIVFLRHVEAGAELLRLVSVMKTRDSAPDRRLWRYEIGDGGVELLEPFAPADHRLITGGGAGPKPPRRKGG
jgi:circadian clock protein KaiC